MTTEEEVIDLLPDRCPFTWQVRESADRMRCVGQLGHPEKPGAEHYWTPFEAEGWMRVTKERFLEAMRGRPGWGA
ncbi:hypothetical protein SEA_NAMAGO_7 [Microbacterium phage Namago]|uniref:Uncharacterized protein n=1 Tax=Microbacterium phage Judebell TaxID=3230835 RepID=A0AAU8EH78_9CAUD|nr:hypothetical protein SEA_NAMAGO_7 [Microbacterium phage Namago]